MDYNNGYEQEIDLKELMFAVLRKWRPILAAAVALAVVLGGYKSVSAYRAGNDEKAQKAAQKEYETELELYNKNVATCEREIENLTKDIANQQEYLEELMEFLFGWLSNHILKSDKMIAESMK